MTGVLIQNSPYRLGKNYLVRTVTNYFSGQLVGIYEHELVLEAAAWIADTGRFSEALKTGVMSEVEPIPGQVIIGRGAIVDVCEWPEGKPLPDEVK